MNSLLSTGPDFSREPPRVLLVSDDERWPEMIASLLMPFPFDLTTATSVGEALRRVSLSVPEAAIIHARPGDTRPLEIVAGLRREGLGRESPIIILSDQPQSREERVALLQAGAWDVLDPGISGEELAVKVHAYLGATRAVVAARQHTLLDESSGLYNLHGILRWARELSNTAKRYKRPFGCAVFAPAEPESNGLSDHIRPDSWEDRSRVIALHLTSHGRSSDIVGRIGAREYVVLAPDADPSGIMEMANRFVREAAVESNFGLRLRAGCSAVENLAAESVEPAELIARATLALSRTRAPEFGNVEFFGGKRASAN